MVKQSSVDAYKSNKSMKMAAGIVAVGGVILLVALVLTNVFGVSRADLKRANERVGAVHSAYLGVSEIEKCQGRSTTTAAFNSCIDATQASFEEMEEEFAKLGEERAIQRDRELREKYEKIEDELVNFRGVYNLGVDYLRVLAPIIFANTNYTTSNAMVDGFRSLAVAVREVSVDSSEVVRLRDGIAGALDDMANATNDGNEAALNAAVEIYTDLLESLQEDFESLDDYSFAEMMKELDDMIVERVN
ncbi:DUF4200 domain-containing protein [Candidatus Saccharibacteria bacterium]|nr:DUF4200 domain-containing protein [Candidatus Saccharibacteria bacterium]